MNTNNAYQSNNNSPTRETAGVAFGYDMEEEKQRISLGTEEIKKELLDKWRKTYANAQIFPAQVAAMHPEVVDFLLSFNMVSVYDDIARQADLDAKSRNALPAIVWQITQAKKWESLDQILEAQLPLVHSAHIVVADLLQQNVLDKIRALSERPVIRKTAAKIETKKEIQLPLSQALSQYPNLGEQSVTGNPLKLRYFPNPVRPSIKNWITDFHDNMGAGKHGAIDRGNYLFHSDNGKKLTPVERQKLSELFKSLDEQTSINIDIEAQTVVFGNVAEEKGRSSVSSNPVAAENDDIFQRYVSHPPQGKPRPNLSQDFSSDTEPKNRPNSSSNFITKLTGIAIEKKPADVENLSRHSHSHPHPSGVPDTFSLKGEGEKEENLEREKGEMKKTFVSPNFASSEGIVSFSSSQKLPVEQKAVPASPPASMGEALRAGNASRSDAGWPAETSSRPVEQPQKQVLRMQPQPRPQSQPQLQNNNITFPKPQPIRQSQWHIAPTRHHYEENGGDKKDTQQKIDKNIVDLRN